MRTQIRTGGYNQNGRRVRLSIMFNEGKLENARAVAKSSLVGWGEWQGANHIQTKYGPAWYVTTAGHGGYILVTQKKHDELGTPQLSINRSGNEVYVYEFEEDCMWARLEYLDPNARRFGMRNTQTKKTPEEYMEAIKKTLANWNTQWFLELDAQHVI